ncbi:MAG TPA: UDP-N-acetylmuramate dehydrogenase [Ferruginibacter sp.]|nr:UDP-N-acetylmuramate dehydrogenase [Ferruginibacter sp.]
MLQENYSLKNLNTFGINAYAKYFAAFTSIDELGELTGYKDPLFVLGGGSNILFTKDYDGLVIKNGIRGIDKINEDDDAVYLKAGAGENWHSFVLYCLENNYAGVENLALIPGNTGATPMQNIGAYGVEIKDVFHSLEAFHLGDKKIVTFNNADCGFDYRESVFKNKYKNQFVITSVTYRLNKKPVFNTSYGAIEAELEKMNISSLSIQSIARAVINIRSSKLPDPEVIGNAGSFFKNPFMDTGIFNEMKNEFPGIVAYPFSGGMKLAAGWLIEQCGWKGYRNGDAGCHEKQALVLVNYGNARGSDIYSLSEEILKSVQQKFNVTLQREVNII